MNKNDPTEDALAAIASLFERPAEPLRITAEPQSEVQPSEVTAAGSFKENAANPVEAVAEMPVAIETPTAPTVPEMSEIDIDRYTRVGPGPLDAIRFRWVARRNDVGNYFVDETIGPNSRPLSAGPMPRDEVVAYIDARARDAQRRFDVLKLEMTFGASAAGDYGADDGNS